MMPTLFLFHWHHKGREGPRLIPKPCTVEGDPYWARVYGLMDDGKLKLMINIRVQAHHSIAVPFWSQNLLNLDRTVYTIPPKPARMKHCKIELYSR